jgi:hypothetical protein
MGIFMAGYYLSDDDFIKEWKKIGSPEQFARIHKQNIRSVYNRRRSIETRLGIELPSFNDARITIEKKILQTEGHTRRGINIEKGRVIVFSDAHFWPDITTTAFKALLESIKEFKPTAIICNGDAFDGAGISRHPRMDFDKLPSVKEELEACQHYLGEIEKVAKGAKLFWPLGNHDMRFTANIVNYLPAYEGVPGTSLKEFFPAWFPCWSFWINEDTCIKHRWKGGWTGGRNNSLNSGVNMVTGHTHCMNVVSINDYNGRRFGVQTGTLADPHGQQFNYTEDAPKDWVSGFVMLSWEKSRLLQPEMIMVIGEDEVDFRGKIHKI